MNAADVVSDMPASPQESLTSGKLSARALATANLRMHQSSNARDSQSISKGKGATFLSQILDANTSRSCKLHLVVVDHKKENHLLVTDCHKQHAFSPNLHIERNGYCCRMKSCRQEGLDLVHQPC